MNIFLRIYVVAIIVSLLIFSANSVSAAALEFPQNTTIELTLGGTVTNFTVNAGSNVDSIETTASKITVTISGGQSFTLSSADGFQLTNNGGFDYTCPTGGASVLGFSLPGGSGQRTVVITPARTTCSASSSGGGGSGAGGGGGGGASSAATPTPTPALTPITTPTADGIILPAKFGLKEGDVVSAAGSDDPDVYIVNQFGYKRLFLNPIIFNFYGHLGGFSKVKKIVPTTRDVFTTSGLFRNCEANDPKVYGVEVTAEDGGVLHWVNTTGDQAVTDDPNFFKKVFCINTREFNWYPKSTAYTSVSQVPFYNRKNLSSPAATPAASSGRIKVVNDVAYLNVRDSASTSGKFLGKVLSGEEYAYTQSAGGWYFIQKGGKDFGWVSGQYVTVVSN